MTATPTLADPGARPHPKAPSWNWAIRRAGLGLAIMFAVTGLAAYIANASIEPAVDGGEVTAPRITIGTPAAPLLKSK